MKTFLEILLEILFGMTIIVIGTTIWALLFLKAIGWKK